MEYLKEFFNVRVLIIIVIFILISVVPIILRKMKHYKGRVNKKELVTNNKFVLENKEKLEKVIDSNYIELNPLKKRLIFSIILFVIGIVSLFFINNNRILGYIIISGCFIFLAISFYQYNAKAKEKYIEMVKNVIHEYDNDLDYQPNNGFSYAEYKMCRFPENCDRFTSEDMIVNFKKSFYFADIKVESEHEDSDDNTYYVTEYEGSLAKIKIKDIGCEIYLGGMGIIAFFQKENYQHLKFENDEFNSLFNAYASNELIAYKILTPDVMEEFVNIKTKMFGDIDIRIIRDTLYIRFLSGDGFINSSFNLDVEKNSLFQSIAVLEEVIKMMDKVKNIIENKNDL